jgi:hypothetical protein
VKRISGFKGVKKEKSFSGRIQLQDEEERSEPRNGNQSEIGR